MLALTIVCLSVGCDPTTRSTSDFPILGTVTRADIYSPAIYSPPIVITDSASLDRLVRSINAHRSDWDLASPWGGDLDPSPAIHIALFNGKTHVGSESLICNGWIAQYQAIPHRQAFRNSDEFNTEVRVWALQAMRGTDAMKEQCSWPCLLYTSAGMLVS